MGPPGSAGAPPPCSFSTLDPARGGRGLRAPSLLPWEDLACCLNPSCGRGGRGVRGAPGASGTLWQESGLGRVPEVWGSPLGEVGVRALRDKACWLDPDFLTGHQHDRCGPREPLLS